MLWLLCVNLISWMEILQKGQKRRHKLNKNERFNKNEERKGEITQKIEKMSTSIQCNLQTKKHLAKLLQGCKQHQMWSKQEIALVKKTGQTFGFGNKKNRWNVKKQKPHKRFTSIIHMNYFSVYISLYGERGKHFL